MPCPFGMVGLSAFSFSIDFGSDDEVLTFEDSADVLENGMIFRKIPHRFFPGLEDLTELSLLETKVNGFEESVDDFLSAVDGEVGEDGCIPSNDTKTPPEPTWKSFLMIKRRRPGAGLQGAVDGGTSPFISACSRT